LKHAQINLQILKPQPLSYNETHPNTKKIWFSGIFRDAPPNVGRIANPTYAAPPDMLVYHGNSQ
jgi:hypothetical protein